jgi:Ca2+-binding RTX toxin-like protein
MPVQATDIHKTAASDPGIDFSTAYLFWMINPEVTVSSDLGNGVNSSFVHSTLLNHGTIASTFISGYGVYFGAIAGTIVNYSDGLITGYSGVCVHAYGTEMTNLGTISAIGNGFYFDPFSGNGDKLDNQGTIFSATDHAVEDKSLGSDSINNSGMIEGAIGVGIDTAAAAVTQLVNSGTIRGDTYSIVGSGGALQLWNAGTLSGDFVLNGSANDTIDNSGSVDGLFYSGRGDDAITNRGIITGSVHLGEGNDSFTSSGRASAEVLGEAGNDSIVNTGRIDGTVDLGDGDDSFNGTGGSSGAIFGGVGNDTIAGGGGNDTADGGDGNDKLAGAAGNDTLSGGLGADILTGGAGNDALDGGDGNDTLTGGDGNDTVIGGLGTDILIGGAGADKLVGGLGNDKLTGGAGIDFFVFDTKPNAVSNHDIVTDFAHGDKLDLAKAVFTNLGHGTHLDPAFFHAGKAAADANDHIIYDHAHGTLFYDSNGVAAGGATLIAVLSTHPVLTAADFALV